MDSGLKSLFVFAIKTRTIFYRSVSERFRKLKLLFLLDWKTWLDTGC